MNQQRNDSWHNYFLMELLGRSQQAHLLLLLQPACGWNINNETFFQLKTKHHVAKKINI
jgi:hypothetical protein